jgi:hypothetical protein
VKESGTIKEADIMGILSTMFEKMFEREIEDYKSISIEYQNGTVIKIDIVKNKENSEEL